MKPKKEIKYCRCEECSSVNTETNESGQWDVCDNCNKPIEDSYELTDPNYSEY